MPEVETIADGGWRRCWTAGERLRAVEGILDGRTSISGVARRSGAGANLLHRWRRLTLEGGSAAVADDDEVTSSRMVREMEACVRGPERHLGRKTVEVEILREALDKARPRRTDVAHAVAAESPASRLSGAHKAAAPPRSSFAPSSAATFRLRRLWTLPQRLR